MIFRYMSDLKNSCDDIQSARVNFHTFLKKFNALIPQKQKEFPKFMDPSDQQQEITQMRREFIKAEQKIGFDIIDIDGDGKIKIYDLIYNCSVFNKQSLFGKQLQNIYEDYMDKNVRSKHARNKFTLDFNSFFQLYPKLHLVNDLKYVFQRITNNQDAQSSDSDANTLNQKSIHTIQKQMNLDMVADGMNPSFHSNHKEENESIGQKRQKQLSDAVKDINEHDIFKKLNYELARY